MLSFENKYVPHSPLIRLGQVERETQKSSPEFYICLALLGEEKVKEVVVVLVVASHSLAIFRGISLFTNCQNMSLHESIVGKHRRITSI